MTPPRVERQGSDERPSKPLPPTRRANLQSGVTFVELMTAMMITGILLSAAVPAFRGMVTNNQLRQEANRFVMDIQFARSEAIKRGSWVNMCRANVEACDVDEPTTCVCKEDVPLQRYDHGWLVYATRGLNKNFKPGKGDTLLRVGAAPPDWVTIYGNKPLRHRVSILASGEFKKNARKRGLVVLCADAASSVDIPGRAVEIKFSGRTATSKLLEDADCTAQDGDTITDEDDPNADT